MELATVELIKICLIGFFFKVIVLKVESENKSVNGQFLKQGSGQSPTQSPYIIFKFAFLQY